MIYKFTFSFYQNEEYAKHQNGGCNIDQNDNSNVFEFTKLPIFQGKQTALNEDLHLIKSVTS